jgi:glutathione S-transferase
MRLFITPTSPFARKARVVVREVDLIDRIEEIDVPLRTLETPLLAVNPLIKVPTLETTPGRVLTESSLIAAWLDQATGGRLMPGDDDARLEAAGLDGLGIGLLESLGLRSRFLRVPDAERSPTLIGLEEARCQRGYDRLEQSADRLAATGLMPQITIGCALGFVDFRLPDEGWRVGRPRLAAWFELFAERPSMQETAPPAA